MLNSNSRKDNFTFLSEIIIVLILSFGVSIKLVHFSSWVGLISFTDLFKELHLTNFIIFGLPIFEIVIVLLLLISKLRKVTAISVLFLSIIYVAYGILKLYIWKDGNCPCGGIFNFLTMDKQQLINYFLMIVAFWQLKMVFSVKEEE